jgi:predicted DNA-binding transcriptional regulator YafY
MSGRSGVNRLERLVNLLVALLDTRRPLSRDELRERVGGYSEDPSNFRRNFERDKDLLRQMGIPVLAEPLNPGSAEDQSGYWVPRELYEMADPGLDEEELMALSLAASLVEFREEGEGGNATTAALRKLAGAGAGRTGALRPSAGPGASEGSGDGPSAAVLDVPLGPEVTTLFSGVAGRQVVRFTYNGISRRVEPYRLSYRDGRWYLAGFDQGRAAERLFRVDRVEGGVELEGEPGAFNRPDGALAGPPPPWRLGDEPAVSVELRVDATQAPWVSRLAGAGPEVVPGPDGDVVFSLEVTNWEGFRGFVLGLLDHAEVLSPPQARDKVVSWLSAMAAGSPPGAVSP